MPVPTSTTQIPHPAATKLRPWEAVLRLALAIYLPGILVLIGVAYGLLRLDINTRIQTLQAQEIGEVQISEQLLLNDIEHAISDLQFLSRAPSLKRYLNNNSASEKLRVTEHFMNMLETKQRYDQAVYFDNNGMEIIRADLLQKKSVAVPARSLQNKFERYFFADTQLLAAGEIFISQLDLNIENGKIQLPLQATLRVGTPMFNQNGTRNGVLMLNYHGQALLDDFIHAMKDRQHAMLLNQDGYWLSHPDPSLEWGFMFDRDDTFAKYYPEVWQSISSKKSGSILRKDGLYTFTTINPLLASQQLRPHKHNSSDTIADGYSMKIVSLVPAAKLPSITFNEYPRSYALVFTIILCFAWLAFYIASNLTNRKQLRAAVFENEARLKEITSTLGEGIFVLDKQGYTTYANPEAERLLGWTQAELMGQHAHTQFHYRNADGSPLHAADCEIYRVMQTGISYRSNTQVYWRKDGSPLHVDVSASPIVREGNIVGTVVAISDISKEKKAEAALLNTTLQLKQAQRLAQIGSWELDINTRTLAWSDEIYRIFEIDRGTFAPSYEAFLTAIHPDDRERVNLAYTEAVNNHTHYSIEHRLLLPDGRTKYVLERGETFYDTNDNPIRSIGTVQDITERKVALQALRYSEEAARALLNATTESAILVDASGIVLAINEVGAKRIGKDINEIIKRSIYGFFPTDIAASRKSFVEQIVLSGEPGQFQDSRRGKHFDHSLYPILDGQGNVSHIAIYTADITERIKLQAEETLLHHIDQQVLHSNSLPDLMQFICDEVIRLFDYQFAWLGKKESDGDISIFAQSGKDSAYLQDLGQIGVRWDDTPQGSGPAGGCIRSGKMQVVKISDANFKPWHDAAVRYDFKSIVGIPLIVRKQVYGALLLYSRLEQDFDDTSTQQRLSGIALRICVALETAMDQEQLRLLSSALSSAGNGVFITDIFGRILWINDAFTRLTGYSSEETVGNFPSLLKSGKQDAHYYKSLWHTIQQGKTWSNETVERHKSGALFTVQQTITPIKNETGEISHYISILDDISLQKETAARIHHMAHFDALTGLPNRALFRDRLRQTLSQAKRDGTRSALMFLDLDRFKSVNDTHGHHIGDLLLKAVADRISACVRESDSVSRLAGDEFTVLLPHVDNRANATLIADKITRALAAPFHLDGHVINIGSSTGIAFYPADAKNEEELIKCADKAMYQAKEHGRGIYRFYQSAQD